MVQAFEGNLVWAAYWVGIAAVLDFLDGFAARILKVVSPIGKDLDSLADMVTFGVVPGVVMYKLINFSFSKHLFGIFLNVFMNDKKLGMEQYLVLLAFLGFAITIFSAIRLAKFNNDPRQSDSFIGLPTPANAILICSLPLIANLNNVRDITTFPLFGLDSLLIDPYFLVTLTIVLCYLLIAPIPLFAMKFKSFGWEGNQIRYVFLGLSIGLLIGLQYIGIPLIIFLYILMSIINNLLNRKKAVSA